jgi:hypothetical protein
MFDNQKADEWTPLKEQLEALVHEADMLEDAVEQSARIKFVAGLAN